MKRNIKLLIFHRTVAPYRLAFFNELYNSFQTEIFLYYKNMQDNKIDYSRIEDQFVFTPTYCKKKKVIFGREFYFGHIREIAACRPDMVVVGEYNEALLAAALYRFFHRRKYKIISICDDSKKIAEDCGGLRKISRNLGLKQIDGLLLCNEDVQEWYRANLGVKNSFVFPIIQSEDVIAAHYEEIYPRAKAIISENELTGKRVFLYVGRLAPEKNIGYLVNSFIAQHSSHPENVLFIIGGTSSKAPGFREETERKIDSHNAGGYIRFLGRLEGTELTAWYMACQVFVLPSSYEPFGAVVNEALLAGEYAMVSDRAGASCLINHENGEIIDISQPLIHFDDVCRKITPVTADWRPHESRMPYSFKEKMNGLLAWMEELATDGGRTKE